MLIPYPACADDQVHVRREAVLHLPENGVGIQVGGIGVEQARLRAGRGGGAHKGVSYRPVLVLQFQAQVVHTGHPLEAVSLGAQAQFLRVLLGIRVQEEIEKLHRGGIGILDVLALDGGIVGNGHQFHIVEIPVHGGAVTIGLELVVTGIIIRPGILVAGGIPVAVEDRVGHAGSQCIVLHRGHVLEESGIDVLLAMAHVQQNIEVIRGSDHHLGAVGAVIGIVEFVRRIF